MKLCFDSSALTTCGHDRLVDSRQRRERSAPPDARRRIRLARTSSLTDACRGNPAATARRKPPRVEGRLDAIENCIADWRLPICRLTLSVIVNLQSPLDNSSCALLAPAQPSARIRASRRPRPRSREHAGGLRPRAWRQAPTAWSSTCTCRRRPRGGDATTRRSIAPPTGERPGRRSAPRPSWLRSTRRCATASISSIGVDGRAGRLPTLDDVLARYPDGDDRSSRSRSGPSLRAAVVRGGSLPRAPTGASAWARSQPVLAAAVRALRTATS